MLEEYDKLVAFHLFGLPINWTIASTWIVMAILMLVSWLATRGLGSGLKVSRWQTAMEVIVGLIRGQIKEMANDNPMKYMPLVGTFFLFIFTSNLLTIIPWFKPPTASLSTTAAFASVVMFGIPIYGMKNAGFKGYIAKYTQPVPFLAPINILSDLTSTMAMAVRLFGNVLSGVMIGSIFIMLVPFILPLPMQVLGLFTGTIQAYIFAILAVVYLSSVSPVADEEAYAEVQRDERELLGTAAS